MNAGRIAVLFILGAGLIGGAAMFYLQVWGYYDEVTLSEDPIVIGDAPAEVANFEGIDASSSPIRYRACFEIDAQVAAALPDAPDAEPLNAPFWFDCFDAAALGADIASGAARPVMLQANRERGVDRVAAVYPDGRAFAWQRLNEFYDDTRRVDR